MDHKEEKKKKGFSSVALSCFCLFVDYGKCSSSLNDKHVFNIVFGERKFQPISGKLVELLHITRRRSKSKRQRFACLISVKKKEVVD